MSEEKLANEEEFTLRIDPSTCKKCTGHGQYVLIDFLADPNNPEGAMIHRSVKYCVCPAGQQLERRWLSTLQEQLAAPFAKNS